MKFRSSFLIPVIIGALLGVGVAAAATKKTIVYFTSGSVPTTAEKAEIVKLKNAAAVSYDIRVLNSKKVTSRVITPDYVAGAIAPVYRDGGVDSGTSLYTVVNPNAMVAGPNLPTNEAIVRNGVAVSVPGGGSVTFTISSNTITATAYVAPDTGG